MGRVRPNEKPGAGRRPLTRRSHPGSLGTGDRPAGESPAAWSASPRDPSSLPAPGRTGRVARRPRELVSLRGGRLGRATVSSPAASPGRGFRDEPPGAAAASSGRRGGSSPARLLPPRGSQAPEGMRVLRTLAAGAGS